MRGGGSHCLHTHNGMAAAYFQQEIVWVVFGHFQSYIAFFFYKDTNNLVLRKRCYIFFNIFFFDFMSQWLRLVIFTFSNQCDTIFFTTMQNAISQRYTHQHTYGAWMQIPFPHTTHTHLSPVIYRHTADKPRINRNNTNTINALRPETNMQRRIF